jgi:hypothetical protein
MTEVSVEHNGKKIVYSENQDVWRCWEMDLEAKTLSALKNKMNKVDAEARRLGNVAAFIMEEHQQKPTPVVLTMIDGDAAWGIRKSITENSNRRQKIPFKDLIPDTPEGRAAIIALQTKYRELSAIREEAKALYAAIPRMTLDMLKSIEGRTDGIN